MARQQRLELRLPPHYHYGDWVRHGGVEAACARLALWLIEGGNLWLTSTDIAGKTHLLHALAAEHPALGVVAADDELPAPQQVQQWLERLSPFPWWAVDLPAGPMPRPKGIALFHLFERAREQHRPLLLAWRGDAATLPPELSSRLATMLRAEMAPPQSDGDLRAVLRSAAALRQWQLPDEAIDLLLRQLPRQLPELLAALDHLDRSSMEERQRPARLLQQLNRQIELWREE